MRSRWAREAGGGDRDGGCWNPSRPVLRPRGRAAADRDTALLGESPLLKGAHPPPKPGRLRQSPPLTPGLTADDPLVPSPTHFAQGGTCILFTSQYIILCAQPALTWCTRLRTRQTLLGTRFYWGHVSAGDTSLLGPLFFPILLLYSFQSLPHTLRLENSTSILASRKFSLITFTPTGIPHRMYVCVT